MTIKIDVFRTLEDAREPWQQIERDGVLTVFQTHAWLENWYHHIGRSLSVEPCLVLVSMDDSPCYFFPLGVYRKGPLRVLQWFGGELIDYGAPIVAGRAAAGAPIDGFNTIWNEVLRHLPDVDVVWLAKMPEKIHATDNPILVLKCDPYHSSAYYATLAGKWEAFYESHAGAKTRSTDRRKRRRLAEHGELRTRIAQGDDPAGFEAISREMVAQKEKRYDEIHARNILADEGHRRFFTQPTDGLARSGWLHASILSLDGEGIAAHWGMIHDGRFYYYMPSFAKAQARFSPGRLLLFDLFQWCIDRGVGVFDFTIGNEMYKRDWCDYEVPLFQYFSAHSARGGAYRWMYQAYLLLIKTPFLLKLAKRVRRLLRSLSPGAS